MPILSFTRCERHCVATAAMDRSRARGFTLIELVCVIVILGVLAAVAVPRLIDIGTQARIASLAVAKGAVSSAAGLAMLKCRLVDGCAVSNAGAVITGPGGVVNSMFNGYPTGFTRPTPYGYFGIKDWVQMDGYTTNEVNYQITEFTQDGASDPSNCKVSYTEAAYFGALPAIVSTATGC